MGDKNRILQYDMVYVCHSVIDKKFARKTIELLFDIGLNEEQVMSSYSDNYSIPLWEDRYEYIRDKLNRRVVVIFLISNNFYNDIICNQDVGALTALNCDCISVVTADFTGTPFRAIYPDKKIIELGAPNVKVSLRKMKGILEESFCINRLSDDRWEQCRDDYINELTVGTCSFSEESTWLHNAVLKVINNFGGQAYFSCESVESIGFTKAESKIIINELLKTKRIRKDTFGRYKWET